MIYWKFASKAVCALPSYHFLIVTNKIFKRQVANWTARRLRYAKYMILIIPTIYDVNVLVPALEPPEYKPQVRHCTITWPVPVAILLILVRVRDVVLR